MEIEVTPADRATCHELDGLFEAIGAAAECRCQRYRLARGEAFRTTPVEERAVRLHLQTGCGGGETDRTTGLVARIEADVVGWCAVAPRASYPGLVRNGSMAAWTGRQEDRSDPDVWAVTCVLVRKDVRRRGVATELVAAAIPFARDHGATRLEAYPIEDPSAVGTENHPGVLRMYEAAGFEVIHRPSKRRVVVGVDLT